MGRAWSQSGVQKGSSLCAETFDAEIRRSARRGFCHPGSSQGPTHRGVSRPCSGRRPVPLQVKGTPPGKGKQRIVHDLCSLNDATAKRQTTYEDLRMLKSVVRPQDCMLSLDVESTFFHVPIHPKHRKFFSSHLSLPLFVKNKFIELQAGGYFVCSRPDLASLVPSAQTPLHLRHLYHQVVEFSHATLPLGWTSSPRIWTSVMSVATAALRRHGIRLVDRLLLLRGNFKVATNNRGHAPRHGHSPRATQGLIRHSDPDPVRPFGFHHLLHWQRSPTGSREKVLRAASSSARAAFPGSQESSSRRLRPPSAFLRGSHLFLASSSAGPLLSPRSLQHARAVQAKVFPLSSSCRQPAFLAQLFGQEPREPARTLTRSTIYCPLHRRIGHHSLGFGVGTTPPGNEIERWMVGVARGAGNDSAQGAQGVPPRLASERRIPTRSHGQALSGQPGRLWSLAQNVIQVPSTYVRDQGPRTLATRKQDPPRRGLHSQRSKLGRCAIAPTGPRHVVLAAAYSTRALAPGRVDFGLTVLHRSLRLQAERSGSKICHSAPLSPQCSFQRLAPRLVVTRHALVEPAMTSTASSLGKTSSVKVKRYCRLQHVFNVSNRLARIGSV
jgi:hypothetical protein